MLRLFALTLPVLLPSWRFFQSIEPSPRLEWRDAEGLWQEYRPRPARVSPVRILRRLFWNARWNEGLFLVSLAERVAEAPDAHALREIEQRLRRGLAPARPEAFRLVFVEREDRRVLYASPPLQ